MRWAATLLLVALGAWGCAGTETGNPSFVGTLGYDAYSSNPARVALRVAQPEAAARVDQAWLVLGDVDFARQCAEEADPTAHVGGLGAGDHAATQAPATELTLNAGVYCAVRLPFEARTTVPDGAPPELAGHSILILGMLGDGRAFRIASAYRGELSLRDPGPGFELNDAQSGVVIGFDVAAWLDGLVWPQGSGELRIDEVNHADVLRAFEARVASGVALFRDSDADGQLDSGAAPIARAED